MVPASFILFPNESAWRIAIARAGDISFVDVPIATGSADAQIARQIFQALNQKGYAGEGTILALPSTWCFAASIATDDLPRGDRKAMLYRLEEKLPMPAESLIADFIERPAAHSQSAMGVCVRIESVKPIVQALEAAGVAVQSISPAVLLAVQAMESLEQSNTSAFLCGEPGGPESRINFLGFEGAVPISWAVLPASVDDLKLQLDLMSMEQESLHVESCDVGEPLITDLIDASSQFIAIRDETIPQAAAKFAAEVSAGHRRPWIEFRRGPLAMADSLVMYRRPLNHVLAAAVVLMIACAAVMAVRAWRYEQSRQTAEKELAAEFHKAFPTWTTTPSSLVMKSEIQKARQRMGSGMPAEASRSALVMLRDVLEKLPGNGRFTIDNLTIQESEFEIHGRMKSYEDVDVITSAIRKAGLEVSAPQTRRESDKFWSFTLRGIKPAKPA